MNRWESFLEGLASTGGAILLLFVSVMLLGILCVHMLHHQGYPQDVVSTFLTMFGGANGALWATLQSRAKPTNGNTTTHSETTIIKDTPKETK